MSERVETKLGRLAVHRVGPGPHRVLLWSGLFFDAAQHRPLAERLAEEGVGTLLVEPPGMGDSGPLTDEPDMPACAEALLEVADGLGVKRPVLGGTSWGGVAALHAALAHPAAVAGLVLFNTPLGAGSRQGLFRFIPALTRLPAALFARGAGASLFGRTARTAEGGRLRRVLQESVARAHAPSLRRAIHAVLYLRPGLASRLPALTTPALFLAGDEDGLYPVEELTRMARAAPGMEVRVISGSGHSSALEQTAAVAEAVVPFLRSM